jgi:inhibitor of KinA sporulation pathway (predicted exonuclease)
MRISQNYYLIVDVEATCANDNTIPRHEMEIIEIGAVMQNANTFEIESEFQAFVRPVRHPQLTEFCRTLTGITQADVAAAPSFASAIDAMKQWMDAYPESLFCSWGDYDRKQFIQDCDYHRVTYPFQPGHMNLKAEFSRATGRKKLPGITQALRFFNMNFDGSHHRGLDDAKNIARLVRRVCMPTAG